MGVKDTFRLCNLEPISKEIYMMLWNSDRRTIGVDGYVLLHKYLSNYGEIITRNPQRYIPLVYQNIYNHLHEMAHCIEPIGVFTMIVVFDGNNFAIIRQVPMKEDIAIYTNGSSAGVPKHHINLLRNWF